MSDKHQLPLLTVQKVLNDGVYVIPVYQRNYAWGVNEIEQLIHDVKDYAQRYATDENRTKHDYYIGTLVVYDRGLDTESAVQRWEVVDGQQRLTTLSLLVWVLRGLYPQWVPATPDMPLEFECREASTQALKAIFKDPLLSKERQGTLPSGLPQPSAEDVSGASSIWQGRKTIEDALRGLNDGGEQFADFLLHRVRLLRVELPQGTDLNHYFEVMNNRGEQLAQHEVLKARLLGRLQEHGAQQAMQMLSAVWDACAVMDRSVMSGFEPAMRKCLFAEDGKRVLPPTSADLLKLWESKQEEASTPRSLLQLISTAAHHLETVQVNAARQGKGKVAASIEEDGEDESKVQFKPLITFPNFLLQVLATMPEEPFASTVLDDKHLLKAFEPLLRSGATLIQDFAYRLLRCRFLLDQCLIKGSVHAKEDEEHWLLQRCNFKNNQAALQWVNAFQDTEEGFGERLRMLQAGLHVSYMLPTRKHWLQGVLRWLYQQEVDQPIDVHAFLVALEGLAKALVLDASLFNALPEKLVYGKARLIDFNFLDYLLWLKAKNKSQRQSQDEGSTADWREFEFTSTRRSVEHLHPQTEWIAGQRWEPKQLHAFGNLCLVSASMNARLSNAEPEVKFRQLLSEKKTQSLKALAMHSAFAAHADKWTMGVAEVHQKAMLDLMQRAFDSNGLIDLSAALTEQMEGVQ